MSDYITNTAELTAIADAIRAKGGTTASLVYPDGFVSAIEDIESGGSDSVYVFTEATYSNTDVHVNNTVIAPRLAYQVSVGGAITFYTYGDYILDTVTGVTSGNTVQFTTVRRGEYTFTMPNESVECSLVYDD